MKPFLFSSIWHAWNVVFLFQLFFRCVSDRHVPSGAFVPFFVDEHELYFRCLYSQNSWVTLII